MEYMGLRLAVLIEKHSIMFIYWFSYFFIYNIKINLLGLKFPILLMLNLFKCFCRPTLQF